MRTHPLSRLYPFLCRRRLMSAHRRPSPRRPPVPPPYPKQPAYISPKQPGVGQHALLDRHDPYSTEENEYAYVDECRYPPIGPDSAPTDYTCAQHDRHAYETTVQHVTGSLTKKMADRTGTGSAPRPHDSSRPSRDLPPPQYFVLDQSLEDDEEESCGKSAIDEKCAGFT